MRNNTGDGENTGRLATGGTQRTKVLRVRRALTKGLAAAALGAGLHLTGEPARATDSGLGFYPTADIYPSGNFHFDLDTLGRGVKTDLGTSVGLEYGFGPETDGLFGRNEVGFDYLLSGAPGTTFASTTDRLSLNFKTQLYNNSERGERIAIGFAGLGRRAAFTSVNVRLLGYKTFSFGRIHAGLWRDFRRTTGGSNESGIQLGFDRSIGKRLIVGFDYRTGETGFLAPAIIYNVSDKAGFEIAVGRANSESVSPRYQTYLAFDYNFDFSGDKQAEPPNAPNLETAPGTGAPGTPGTGDMTGTGGATGTPQ